MVAMVMKLWHQQVMEAKPVEVDRFNTVLGYYQDEQVDGKKAQGRGVDVLEM